MTLCRNYLAKTQDQTFHYSLNLLSNQGEIIKFKNVQANLGHKKPFSQVSVQCTYNQSVYITRTILNCTNSRQPVFNFFDTWCPCVNKEKEEIENKELEKFYILTVVLE